ncbi:MAG: RNA polymerase primary sigma factor [Planctomycetota bacterium]|jgi:RNA polymerase primary sigma factor
MDAKSIFHRNMRAAYPLNSTGASTVQIRPRPGSSIQRVSPNSLSTPYYPALQETNCAMFRLSSPLTERPFLETKTVKKKILKHIELDARLNLLVESDTDYDKDLLALVQEVDGKGLSLEITDPECWRKEPGTTSSASTKIFSIEEQFRHEVGRMLLQDREAEARLARRIEFARLRFNQALESAGIDPEDVAGQMPKEPDAGRKLDSGFPEDVLHRWLELHALRTELVERNLYLVLVNVERYAHTRVSRMDLIQEGSSVLFRAADGFDWRRGLLFRTYAVHWLNQAFRSFLYNFGNTIRVPVYLQKAMKHVRDAITRLGDHPHSVEEIAKEADLGEKVVESALGASRSTHSIDANWGSSDDDGLSLRETLTAEGDEDIYHSNMEDVSIGDGIEMALGKLNPRERYVIGLRFGLAENRDHTLSEIATLLGVSLERVRQIQVRAINKMNTSELRKVADPHMV